MTDLARGLRAYWIIGLLAALSTLAGLFTMPPIDRDESRFAQATAQMLETGNFVAINYLDEERNKKPVGIHWLQAAAVSLVSDAEDRQIWAYRLPSLLGVILAALACFWGGQRLVGREAAFAGAALLGTCALLGIEGGIAKTDAMLAGATTLAMAALANARGGETPGWRTGLLFWFAMGLGILIKGPITPMVAGLTALALVAWERRIDWLRPVLVWWGPLLTIVMVLPWLISIQLATEGNFLREALSDDLVPKLVSGHERHGGLPGYHLLMLPLIFFPATLFLLPGIGRVVSAIRGDGAGQAAAARFLVAWVIPTWLVFEILPTKLPHYVLPIYPALALMAGWGFVELARAAAWQRWVSWSLFGVIGLLLASVLPVLFLFYGNNASWDAVRLSLSGFEGGFQLGLDPLVGLAVMVSAVVLAGLTGAALVSDRLRPGALALAFAVLAGLSAQIVGRGVVLPNAYAVRLADQVRAARAYSETITGLSPDQIITASSFTEPSLAFSLGTDTVLGSAEEVLAFAESRDEPTMVVLDLSRDAELRADLLAEARSVYELRQETMSTDWRPRFTSAAPIEPPWAEADRLRADRLAWMTELEICHRALAAGTNYARGTDTVLAIFFTRCAPEDTPNDPQD